MKKPASTWWSAIFYLIALIVLTFIGSLLVFYFQAEKILGHPPVPGLDDPKDLEIYRSYATVIYSALMGTVYSFFAWIILVPVYILANIKRSKRWFPIVFSAIIYGIAAVLLFSRITEWFLD